MGDKKLEAQQKEMEEKILDWAKSYAKERGWNLNPDKKQLSAVIRGLARNWLKHGERYCPCRVRSGDAQIDREIICPCIYHEDEVNNGGSCHCRLFYRETSGTPE